MILKRHEFLKVLEEGLLAAGTANRQYEDKIVLSFDVLKVDPTHADRFEMAAKHNMMVDLISGKVEEITEDDISELSDSYREQYKKYLESLSKA